MRVSFLLMGKIHGVPSAVCETITHLDQSFGQTHNCVLLHVGRNPLPRAWDDKRPRPQGPEASNSPPLLSWCKTSSFLTHTNRTYRILHQRLQDSASFCPCICPLSKGPITHAYVIIYPPGTWLPRKGFLFIFFKILGGEWKKRE